MQQPATGQDSERCAFCHEIAKLGTANGTRHRDNCLNMHCKVIEAQPRQLAYTERKVLVETRGQWLGSRVFAIKLEDCNSSPEAFEMQIKWRIWHKLPEDEQHDLVGKKGKVELVDLDGRGLAAGDVVQVMVAGDMPTVKPIITSFVSDATASVEAYGASDNYDARQNSIAYVISEFIDNALMAAINLDGGAGIPTIKVWILISDDGKQMAIAIEVRLEASAARLPLPVQSSLIQLRRVLIHFPRPRLPCCAG